jgi:hypothetical protein
MTHSQVISRTLYPGRTMVLRGNRALRQDALRAHLLGWLVGTPTPVGGTTIGSDFVFGILLYLTYYPLLDCW